MLLGKLHNGLSMRYSLILGILLKKLKKKRKLKKKFFRNKSNLLKIIVKKWTNCKKQLNKLMRKNKNQRLKGFVGRWKKKNGTFNAKKNYAWKTSTQLLVAQIRSLYFLHTYGTLRLFDPIPKQTTATQISNKRIQKLRKTWY